ncbi:hypothetical protein GCM10012275_22740 [Longimycelium tulufanense]|uniref:PPE domain-containing protein n=1 Tax=Longimycelium tulufanense TaxID=907463 RepID=A0A8J3CF41_9PSEU|nr:PPE domain-containing protein [Longimycelium tulufanense]GGM51263.1 hypothetical protein GCM10012275_22740 [Longimycelium tulufanense]
MYLESTPEADLALTDSPNWAAMSHRELYRAVHDGNDPGQAYSLAQEWTDLANEMITSSPQFAQRVNGTESGWQGSAPDAARAAMMRLATWSESFGQNAHQMGAKVANQAQIAEQARATMPEPVDFDYNQALARFGPRTNGDLAAFQALTQDLQARQAAANAAHQHAIDVMVAMEQQSRTVDATTPLFAPPPTVVDEARTPMRLVGTQDQGDTTLGRIEADRFPAFSAPGTENEGSVSSEVSVASPWSAGSGEYGAGSTEDGAGNTGDAAGHGDVRPQFVNAPHVVDPTAGTGIGGSPSGGTAYGNQDFSHSRPAATSPQFTGSTLPNANSTAPSGFMPVSGGVHDTVRFPPSNHLSNLPNPVIPEVPSYGPASYGGAPQVPNANPWQGTTNPTSPKYPNATNTGSGGHSSSASRPNMPNTPNWRTGTGMRGPGFGDEPGVRPGTGSGGMAQGATAGGTGFGGARGGAGFRSGAGFEALSSDPSGEYGRGSGPMAPGGTTAARGVEARMAGFGPTGASAMPGNGSRPGTTPPMGAGGGGVGYRGEEDKEHRAPGYLKGDDLFEADVDHLPPAVIGVTFKKRDYHQRPKSDG